MKRNLSIKLFLLVTLFSFFPQLALAQSSLALTITPPLTKSNISPGQTWKSAVKVVNNNNVEIDIYLQVMDFKGGSESGTVTFISEVPEGEESDKIFLSRWISLDPGPIKLKPNESKEIPFIVSVPESPAPGGHYAAIMAGTKPPSETVAGSSIKISSLISSLLLLTVKGDIIEEGKIRDFSTEKFIYSQPNVDFSVAFENSGNVHMQPQGEIRIFDMFGKDQGRMTLNHQSEFGNVLPNETRKWTFNWQGDGSFWSMGRYRASLVVGYGDQAYQTDTRELYFWFINFVLLGIVLGSAFLILVLLIISIRFYIRRAIRLTQQEAESLGLPRAENNRLRIGVNGQENRIVDLKVPARPKSITEEIERPVKKEFSLWRSLGRLVAGLLILALLVFAAVFYLNSRQSEIGGGLKSGEQSFEGQFEETAGKLDQAAGTEALPDESAASSTVGQPGSDVSSAPQAGENLPLAEEEIEKTDIRLAIQNGSGQAGVAGRAKAALEGKGFTVASVGNADNFDYKKSIVKYGKGLEEFAREIVGILKVEAEISESDAADNRIQVVLGADY